MTTNFIVGAISPVFTVIGITVLAFLIFVPLVLGAVLIQERQVGIVVKRFGGSGLEPGRLVALNGEAGYQADTLAPGLYFGYWRWQYRILKRSEEHTSELQSRYVISYAVFCLKKKK